jgi:hypothetical protein
VVPQTDWAGLGRLMERPTTVLGRGMVHDIVLYASACRVGNNGIGAWRWKRFPLSLRRLPTGDHLMGVMGVAEVELASVVRQLRAELNEALDEWTLRVPLGDENGGAYVARRRRLSLAS